MRSRFKIAIALGLVAGAWFFYRATPMAPPGVAAVATPAPAAQETQTPSGFAAYPATTPPGAAPGGVVRTPSAQTASATALQPAQIPASQAAALAQPRGNAEPALAPEIAVAAVRRSIHDYGATFGGDPVGTNAEITSALNGNNPTHTRFLDGIPGQRIDANGNLIDQWGTPYFFHQLSATDMEVRSAGPDRIMWTADDVITR